MFAHFKWNPAKVVSIAIEIAGSGEDETMFTGTLEACMDEVEKHQPESVILVRGQRLLDITDAGHDYDKVVEMLEVEFYQDREDIEADAWRDRIKDEATEARWNR